MRVDLNVATLLAFGILLAALSWEVAAPFWAYIVLGLLVAALAYPLHDWLRTHTKRPRISAGLTVLVALIAVIGPLALLAWRIIADMASLVTSLSVADVSSTIQTLAMWSHETFGYPRSAAETDGREILRRVLPPVQSRLAQWVPKALSSAGSFLLGVTITTIVAYYSLVEGEGFLEDLKRVSPMDDDLEERFIDGARNTVDGVVWGQVVTAGLQGALGYIAFYITGIPNAFFWSFVMAVLSFLPVIGAFAVWMPAAIFLFATGQTGYGVFMLVWGLGVVSTVDNVVKPMVIGRSGGLHPLLAFVGVLGGLAAFGIMGFLMGPLVLSMAALVFNLFAETGWDFSDYDASAEDEEDAEAADEGDDPTPA